MNQTSAVGRDAVGNHHDEAYHRTLQNLQARFLSIPDGVPLFRTYTGAKDKDGNPISIPLWDGYLASFSSADRQYHTCSACRDFVRRFGSLVTIDDGGRLRSAIWNAEDATSPQEAGALSTLHELVESGGVILSPFLSSEKVWGTPETGPWVHFALIPSAGRVYKVTTKTAGQAMAEKVEDFKNIRRALSEYPPELIDTAVRVLKSDALYRGEHILGGGEWLQGLHKALGKLKGSARDNVLWREVAKAPAGFCHPRSGMIGTLLEDLSAGMSFEDVSKRFAAKMHPLLYQRPQAAPKAGNIAQAEKTAEALGITSATLARRIARADEIQYLWAPLPNSDPRSSVGGVFGKIEARGSKPAARPVNVDQTRVTWEKFVRTVLADRVDAVQVFAPAHGGYGAFTTAVDKEGPPIWQWDSPEARNPVSMYTWINGSPASQYSLSSGWVDVVGIAGMPWRWKDPEGDSFRHRGKSVLFVLKGSRETRQVGLALFPEFLRSELHGVRSVFEAYSRNGVVVLSKPDDPQEASGLLFSSSSPMAVRIRVVSGSVSQEFLVDRWD